jgi:hypothetical protein
MRTTILILGVSVCMWTACGDDDGGPDEGDTADTADTAGNADTDTVVSSAFPPSGASLVFAAIGDFGDTVDLADDDTETLRVATMMKSWNPSFIVSVGDNDYSDGEFAGSFGGLELGTGQYFHEFIGNYVGTSGAGASENAFFPAPGDHDYGDDCDNPRIADYLAYFTLPVGESDETYYSVRKGPVELFSLDSVVDCHQDSGAKMATQRAWLERVASASDAPFKIVAFHHPPYSSGSRHGSAEYMQWPFGSWGVDVVLSGDDHIYERVVKDDVNYLVIGLGGVDIHDFGTPVEGSMARYNGDYGALGMAVVGEQLDIAFVSADGTVQDRFTLGEPTSETDPLDLNPDVAPVTGGDWYKPGVATTWQWQLQGTLNTSYEVDAYDIDLFDTDAGAIAALQTAGRKVVCYFSAGSYEEFRDDASQFAAGDLGATLGDFPDERWLDVRSAAVLTIMHGRLDMAVAKGCDAVEPDNMDGYDNDNGLGLTATDQQAYNRALANAAHRRGLGVALKNDLDQVAALVDYYDFAVNEQCHQYDECDKLAPFTAAGKAVFVAEYEQQLVDDASARATMCAAARAADLRALVLPLDLDDAFRFSCD